MSIRNLEYLLHPRSIAVIGASNRPRSVGNLVMRNLLRGGFAGPVMPVNPKHSAVAGVLAYPDIAHLPQVPDLGIICTPARTVPELIHQLGEQGTRAAVVLTAGLRDVGGENLIPAMLEAAQPHGMRILGPNCIGVLVTGSRLDASFVHEPALPGSIAFVSQSGALCTAVLDWARPRGIGFSHFISVGDAADVDVGDLLDYLGGDPSTHAILLYLESIRDRRKFMSAARAAARVKPVLVVKSGREPIAAQAATSHTGALAGSDAVFDAAIRRAGMLRVPDLRELFSAVETLARGGKLHGDRLAVITNGGGPGVMAVDELIAGGGTLAELTAQTYRRLDEVLPSTWSHSNPVDIIGDATGERYQRTLEILMEDPGVDAVLVMHAPTAVADPDEVARAVARVATESPMAHKHTILTNWMGDYAVQNARRILANAGIRTYRMPESAVRAFLHMREYQRNQEMLMQIPPQSPAGLLHSPQDARRAAKQVIDTALAEGISVLSEPDAKMILAAYGIPTVETHVAATPEDAARCARQLGGTVALKILSPDITHKSDVGGVMLNLETPDAVEAAARAMLERVASTYSAARISGFTVQRMARMPGAHELIIGVAEDPLFGPVILFGQGGTAVEVIGDRAVALLPLNMSLAYDLITRTRIYRLLQGYRDRPAANLNALCVTLLQVSQLVIDMPEIVELDINPLFASPEGVLAVDARIRVQVATDSARRLAIRPYPQELEEDFTLRSGRTVHIRPIRPEDEPAHQTFVAKLSPEDVRFRFFGMVRQLPHSQMARLTQIDYDREMAFIATARNDKGEQETLAEVRMVTDPNNQHAEFAIAVRSDLKGQGLGKRLLVKMIEYCRMRGTREIIGQVMSSNVRMLGLAESLGFVRRAIPGDQAVEMRLPLGHGSNAS